MSCKCSCFLAWLKGLVCIFYLCEVFRWCTTKLSDWPVKKLAPHTQCTKTGLINHVKHWDFYDQGIISAVIPRQQLSIQKTSEKQHFFHNRKIGRSSIASIVAAAVTLWVRFSRNSDVMSDSARHISKKDFLPLFYMPLLDGNFYFNLGKYLFCT